MTTELLQQATDTHEMRDLPIRLWPRLLALIIGLALLTPTLLLLNDAPAPWWDEGWTMLVARHWVADGFYGRMPATGAEGPGLSAAFPTTALVALSFTLFGVGVWQARLPSVIVTIISLVLLYTLARRLYDRTVAWGTLAIVLLTGSHLDVNPVHVGRQVLAEPIQICALLGGYLAFLPAARGPGWGWPAALLLWGLALVAKQQTLPFWVASLLLPLGLALWRRSWRVAAVLLGALAGGWLSWKLLDTGIALLLAGHTAPSPLLPGLTRAVALALTPSARELALTVLSASGMPAILGISWATAQTVRRAGVLDLDDRHELVRLMLLSLAASWLLWYAALSIGWPRYAYPALVLASPFAAALASQLTGGMRIRSTVKQIADSLLRGQSHQKAAVTFLVLVLGGLLIPVTASQLYLSFTQRRDDAVFRVLDFLNTQTAPQALVESYESEIFPPLRRPYHYPPDETNVQIIRRIEHHEIVDYDYNPLVANPDYLVIGVVGRASGLYDDILARGAFRIIRHERLYDIYARVR